MNISVKLSQMNSKMPEKNTLVRDKLLHSQRSWPRVQTWGSPHPRSPCSPVSWTSWRSSKAAPLGLTVRWAARLRRVSYGCILVRTWFLSVWYLVFWITLCCSKMSVFTVPHTYFRDESRGGWEFSHPSRWGSSLSCHPPRQQGHRGLLHSCCPKYPWKIWMRCRALRARVSSCHLLTYVRGEI